MRARGHSHTLAGARPPDKGSPDAVPGESSYAGPMTTDVTLRGDRFEISVDGTRAGLTQFVDTDGQRIFFHTELGDEYAGQGLGGELVARALDATREAGLRVVPVCPYVKRFLGKHEEYADLVDRVTPDALAAVQAALRS